MEGRLPLSQREQADGVEGNAEDEQHEADHGETFFHMRQKTWGRSHYYSYVQFFH